MHFFLKDSILKVINTIENAGGEAYIVGGCVRDMLLSRCPEDFDITTSLIPEEILSLFEKTVATGLKHGTVTVIVNGENIEVTTYRTDGTYSDSRHPEEVHFVRNLSEDLARRDFTVNAMAYNPKSGIVDIFGGNDDLNNRVLKAVGDPRKRFKEDALRIMRLFRFACQLDFSIEEHTESAAIELSHLLGNISRERIATELFKALLSPHPEKLSVLTETGALSFCGIERCNISPEISLLPLDRDIRFYKFIADSGNSHSVVCKELKTDKALIRFCEEVSEILLKIPENIAECKKAMNSYSKKSLYSALLLSKGNTALIDTVEQSNEPYRLKDLCLSGDDLIKMGYSGKDLGEALEKLLQHVILYPTDNTREKLINILSK